MGDQNTILGPAGARHLLRRTGFGAPPAEVARLAPLSRGAAADRLLAFRPSKFKPRGRYTSQVRTAWLKYMLRTPNPLQEKLVLFWHDHFATGDDKVRDTRRMADQTQLLRQFCKGNFKAFVKAINTDGAMMEYLDTVRNFADQPNENYARELMELFTLGVQDLAGQPNYDQQDIVQIARAFSGWNWDWQRRRPVFRDWQHDYKADYPERGEKVIFRNRGGFGPSGRDFTQPGGEGAVEIDQVVEILFAHRDSDGKSTVARFITKKLLEYFAHPLPAYPANAAIIDPVVQRSGFDTNWDLGRLLREIFVDDFFYETAAPAPFDASTVKSVVWPVDFVISALRLLRVKPRTDRWGNWYVEGGDWSNISDAIGDMGQWLLEPPSVFGWDWEEAWINSATLLARYSFARNLASARGSRAYHVRSDRLIDLNLTAPADIVNAVLELLGVPDQFSSDERQALANYLGGPLDLRDEYTRYRKLHGLIALVLQSPQFHLH